MKKELKIYLASPRGFCAGVKRAIESIEPGDPPSITKSKLRLHYLGELRVSQHVLSEALSHRRYYAIFVG